MGAATDLDGRFRIQDVPPGAYTVVVSYAGFVSLDIGDLVVHRGGQTEIDPSLSSMEFDECSFACCFYGYPLVDRDTFNSRRVIAEGPYGSCCPAPGIALDYLPTSR